MNGSVLVVDDNSVNLKLACDVLSSEGFSVERAMDATEALGILSRVHIDIVLTDIELPGMDGLTLTQKIKANKRTRTMPVVAMTAFAMKGDDQKAYAAGCDGYITKPIDVRAFPGQVQSILDAVRTGKTGRDS